MPGDDPAGARNDAVPIPADLRAGVIPGVLPGVVLAPGDSADTPVRWLLCRSSGSRLTSGSWVVSRAFAGRVSSILGYMAAGMARDEIIADFPQLAAEDLQEALRYAAAAVSERQLPYRETA